MKKRELLAGGILILASTISSPRITGNVIGSTEMAPLFFYAFLSSGILMTLLGIFGKDAVQEKLRQMEEKNPSGSKLISTQKDKASFFFRKKTKTIQQNEQKYVDHPDYTGKPTDSIETISYRMGKTNEERVEKEKERMKLRNGYMDLTKQISSGALEKPSDDPLDRNQIESFLEAMEKAYNAQELPLNKEAYLQTMEKIMDRVKYFTRNAENRESDLENFSTSNSERMNFKELKHRIKNYLHCLDCEGNHSLVRNNGGVVERLEDPRADTYGLQGQLMTKYLNNYRKNTETINIQKPVLEGDNQQAIIAGIDLGGSRRQIIRSKPLEKLARDNLKNIHELDYTDYFGFLLTAINQNKNPMISASYIGPQQISKGNSSLFHDVGVILGGTGKIYDATTHDLHSSVDSETEVKLANYERAPLSEEKKGLENSSLEERLNSVLTEKNPQGHNELIVGGDYNIQGIYYSKDSESMTPGIYKTLRGLSKQYGLPLYSFEKGVGFVKDPEIKSAPKRRSKTRELLRK